LRVDTMGCQPSETVAKLKDSKGLKSRPVNCNPREVGEEDLPFYSLDGSRSRRFVNFGELMPDRGPPAVLARASPVGLASPPLFRDDASTRLPLPRLHFPQLRIWPFFRPQTLCLHHRHVLRTSIDTCRRFSFSLDIIFTSLRRGSCSGILR
jgi:hypothetical protein